MIIICRFCSRELGSSPDCRTCWDFRRVAERQAQLSVAQSKATNGAHPMPAMKLRPAELELASARAQLSAAEKAWTERTPIAEYIAREEALFAELEAARQRHRVAHRAAAIEREQEEREDSGPIGIAPVPV